MKKVCFFGIYNPGYSRNRVLKSAFEKNGFEVAEVFVDPRQNPGFKKYTSLFKLYQSIKNEKFEHILVCYPGHSIVWLARILFGKRIVFDAFLSLYDANVNDRKLYSIYHPKAWYDWFLDWSSNHLANRILIDTYEHGKYLSRTFYIPRKKIIRVPVSTDETVFYPHERHSSKNPCTIHFHGTYIPLQGVRYILDAARILENEGVIFKLVGQGQEYVSMTAYARNLGLKNVEFIDKVSLDQLPFFIAEADICLGIFGITEKAMRVIPNKVYECAAMGKPVITADSPAVREVFTSELNVILCSPGDGKSIAEAILKLKSNPQKMDRIGNEARKLFEIELSPKKLGERLLKDIG